MCWRQTTRDVLRGFTSLEFSDDSISYFVSKGTAQAKQVYLRPVATYTSLEATFVTIVFAAGFWACFPLSPAEIIRETHYLKSISQGTRSLSSLLN
jgi:hypothetical protein